jgi:hypothetical protein
LTNTVFERNGAVTAQAGGYSFSKIGGPASAAQVPYGNFTQTGSEAVTRPAKSKLQETVTLTDFSVDPTGVSDSSAGWQAALTAAIGGILLVPKGTYRIATPTASLSRTSPYSISIECQAGAVLETAGTKPTDYIVALNGPWTNSHVAGCVFSNTHANWSTTNLGWGAIAVTGGAYVAENDSIVDNTFNNFNRPLQVQGDGHMRIAHNKFLLAHGAASGSGCIGINVGVWSGDNALYGPSTEILIEDNLYDGSVGETLACASGSSKIQAGDGLVFGLYRSGVIKNNTVRHFSYEGIYVLHDARSRESFANSYDQGVLIAGNNIDATFVSGATGLSNWGIRCDASHCDIEQNVILNATCGIYAANYNYPKTGITYGTNWTASDNTIGMSAKPAAAQYGILVAGFRDVKRFNNRITWTGSPSFVAGSYGLWESGSIKAPNARTSDVGNIISAPAATGVGVFGSFVQWTSSYESKNNTFIGLDGCYYYLNQNSTPGGWSAVHTSNSVAGCTTKIVHTESSINRITQMDDR